MSQPTESLGSHHENQSRGDFVAALRGQGLSITEAIKVSMQEFGISLGDAKSLVTTHPSWKATAKAAIPLHNALIKVFEEIVTE